jgi:hypothetical protein
MEQNRVVVRTREIYHSANGDRWLLALDSDTDLFVRHEPNLPSGGQVAGARQPMTNKCKFWWSEVSKWDDHVEKEWIQWIELVAGLSAMIVLTLSLLAVWDGKSP